ncbi:hypothetical protein NL676_005784 [Syzygium grande]|nr:hypothetical protein NL676_005784 [Syzygium grande]
MGGSPSPSSSPSSSSSSSPSPPSLPDPANASAFSYSHVPLPKKAKWTVRALRTVCSIRKFLGRMQSLPRSFFRRHQSNSWGYVVKRGLGEGGRAPPKCTWGYGTIFRLIDVDTPRAGPPPRPTTVTSANSSPPSLSRAISPPHPPRHFSRRAESKGIPRDGCTIFDRMTRGEVSRNGAGKDGIPNVQITMMDRLQRFVIVARCSIVRDMPYLAGTVIHFFIETGARIEPEHVMDL